jgi:hypothetical protein
MLRLKMVATVALVRYITLSLMLAVVAVRLTVLRQQLSAQVGRAVAVLAVGMVHQHWQAQQAQQTLVAVAVAVVTVLHFRQVQAVAVLSLLMQA